jgi:hypothetical protein
VGDEHHSTARVAERAQDGPQLAHLEGREHGGGFVEDEDLRAAIQRLQDLDALRLAHGQVRDEPVGWYGEPGAHAEVVHGALCGGAVQGDAVGDLAAKDDVLRHGECGHQHEVLVHHADSRVDGRGGGPSRDVAAIHFHAAGIRRIEAAEHAHERGLACAILADERMDLAGHDLELGTAVGLHRAERLVDAGEADGGRRHLVLGTLMRPATMSAFSASTRARTPAGIIFALFASYT